jgi:hypothetical protein
VSEYYSVTTSANGGATVEYGTHAPRRPATLEDVLAEATAARLEAAAAARAARDKGHALIITLLIFLTLRACA